MISMIQQKNKCVFRDIWKPVCYTILYNIFLAVYVGHGGRSISGKLPYWYAQYDKAIGWIFAMLAILSSGIVHSACSWLGQDVQVKHEKVEIV